MKNDKCIIALLLASALLLPACGKKEISEEKQVFSNNEIAEAEEKPEETEETIETAETVQYTEDAEESHAVYDISIINPEDIDTATVAEFTVDEERNVSLMLEDGTEIDAGNIGGEEIEGTVEVIFIDYDNRLIKAEMVEKGTSAIPPTSPVREGYEFVGWSGNYTNPTEDMIVSAMYVEKTKYAKVTFCDYDGGVLMVETVTVGGAAKGPTQEPVRDGYKFIGWDSGLENISEDIIITANYVGLDEPVFEIKQVSAYPGDKKVPVIVAMKNNPGICSLKLNFEFAEGLTLTEIKFNKQEMNGTFLGPNSFPRTEEATALWYKIDSNLEEDCTLMTLYFDIADDAEGELFIKANYDAEDVFNVQNENVAFEVIDGCIEIKES